LVGPYANIRTQIYITPTHTHTHTRTRLTGCRRKTGPPPCQGHTSRFRTPAASPPRPPRTTAPVVCLFGCVYSVGGDRYLCFHLCVGMCASDNKGGTKPPTHIHIHMHIYQIHTSKNVGEIWSHSSKRWRWTSETTRRRSGSRRNCSGRTPLLCVICCVCFVKGGEMGVCVQNGPYGGASRTRHGTSKPNRPTRTHPYNIHYINLTKLN
jgi:hypothetical protein